MLIAGLSVGFCTATVWPQGYGLMLSAEVMDNDISHWI